MPYEDAASTFYFRPPAEAGPLTWEGHVVETDLDETIAGVRFASVRGLADLAYCRSCGVAVDVGGEIWQHLQEAHGVDQGLVMGSGIPRAAGAERWE